MSEIKVDQLSPRTASGTITLGSSGDSLTIPSGVTLTNNGTANFGKVLQVVQTVKNDTFTGISNTTELAVTGMSATITPTSTTSKIMISVVLNYCSQSTTYGAYLKRGATIIGVPATVGNRQSVNSALGFTSNADQSLVGKIEYLDSPATTSSTTYQVYVINDNNVVIAINRSVNDYDLNYSKRCISTITLTEIAG